MKAHSLLQGSDAWNQFRLEHFGASEAAAMLGLSKTTRRTELLHMKHTGNAREFSEWVQANILDRGHQVEAMARPYIEAMLEEDLYPVTASAGKLSASCDGLTMDDSTAWEHKQWNEASAAEVRAGRVPEEHMPQCQQVMMVTCATRLIFTVSDGTPERMAHIEVLPDPEWFERIRAGWSQFERDLAEYVPAEVVDKPVGKAPSTLPALRIEISGSVTASNLAEFKQTALAAIHAVNRDLKTDTDFADAAKAVTWCEDVETRLAAAKQHALSQTATIDELFKAIDDISAEARSVRLELDRLVTKRKAEIKDAITLRAQGAYNDHVKSLWTETEGLWISPGSPDFAGAAKNKRSVATLQDAVDVALANGKIEADAAAKRIRECLACIKTDGAGYEFLFADKMVLIAKPIDDLRLIIKTRIADHKVAEAAKEAAKVAAAAAAVVAAPAPVAAPEPVRVAPIATTAKRTVTVLVMTTGAVCDRLGFTLTTAFIKESLHIEPAPAPQSKSGTFWREDDFPRICNALIAHVQRAAQPAEAAA